GGTTLNFSNYLGFPLSGYDIYETQLKIARTVNDRLSGSCLFKKMEKGAIPEADGSQDAILSVDVLAHVPSIPETLREWNRVLRMGGSVAMYCESTFSGADHSVMRRLKEQGLNLDLFFVPEHHISLYPKEELERFFADAGFEVAERFSGSLWH